jgi:hypothetical protein
MGIYTTELDLIQRRDVVTFLLANQTFVSCQCRVSVANDVFKYTYGSDNRIKLQGIYTSMETIEEKPDRSNLYLSMPTHHTLREWTL